MALPTGFAATGAIEPPLHVAPTFGVGVDAEQSTIGAAVAFYTDIPLGMACGAGLQTLAGLAGMVVLPGVEVSGHRAGVMASVAGNARIEPAVNFGEPGQIGLQPEIEGALVRRAAAPGPAELLVAVAAEAGLVAAAAQLRAGAGGDRMGNVEVAAVHIEHVVAEAALLVGKAGLVALQTVGLLVAADALVGVVFGVWPMVQRPGNIVRLQAGETDLIDKALVVAVEADTLRRGNAAGIGLVAGDAGGVIDVGEVGVMVEDHRHRR